MTVFFGSASFKQGNGALEVIRHAPAGVADAITAVEWDYSLRGFRGQSDHPSRASAERFLTALKQALGSGDPVAIAMTVNQNLGAAEKRARQFAAKYVQMTRDAGSEPVVDPSDEALRLAFKDCVKPIQESAYPQVRAQLPALLEELGR